MSTSITNTCFLFSGIDTAACAAWVQAWGTILAVVGAAGIGLRQVSQAARFEASRNGDVLDSLALVLSALHSSAHEWLVLSQRPNKEAIATQIDKFNSAAAMVEAIPLDQVLNPTAVRCLIRARQRIPVYKKAMQTNYPRPDNAEDWNSLVSHDLDVQLIVGELATEAKRLRSRSPSR